MLDFCCAGASTSSSQEKKLFPIFRPKGERKTLYIIRHGESEFNAATNTGKGFSDPQIYDPKLTAKGQSQVCVVSWFIHSVTRSNFVRSFVHSFVFLVCSFTCSDPLAY